jgi:dTDP-4-dehydrorhamnose reductase
MPYLSFALLNHSRPILVFGRDGQVGRALQVASKNLKVPVVFLCRADCDLTSEASIIEVLNQYQPQVIINAAAYTAVDKAESENDLAFAINAKAPELMARYIANIAHGIFVHYSTDYVFAGTKQGAYLETDPVGPFDHLNVYGQSKLAGEQAIEEAFNVAYDSGHDGCADKRARYFILRTSWVYGDGNNFILTMLRMASQYEKLKVIVDQVGAPTSAQWLAEVGLQIADSRVQSGIYHAVPDGETSLYDLVIFAIQTAMSSRQEIKFKTNNVSRVLAVDYPLLAKRPYNSRLSNIKLKNSFSTIAFFAKYPCWQEQVEEYVKNICHTL